MFQTQAYFRNVHIKSSILITLSLSRLKSKSKEKEVALVLAGETVSYRALAQVSDIEVISPKELKFPQQPHASGREGLKPGAVRDEMVSREEIPYTSDISPRPSCRTDWNRDNDELLKGRTTPGSGPLSYAYLSPSI